MKRISVSLFTLLMLIGLMPMASAQFALDQKPAMDKNVMYGKLDNGFTYYIRKNTKPENRMELRLVVKAGSILEDDDQLGLAHFTEHMAFNGTKNFAKNDIIDYLQSIGVRFGADLNAYTSFDETVYMLPIPTDKPEIIDQGFQILEDWAHQVSFEDEEIDKERGVVVEEWRLGLGATERMRQQAFPKILPKSRYKDRLPIGDTTILQNFDYEVIKRFYKDWYRPDLMAVIAIGDFDVKEVKKKIEQHFGSIPVKQNPRKREEYGIYENDEPHIAITQDKEQPISVIQLLIKHPKRLEENWGDYKAQIISGLYNQMLSQRLEELTQQANPPFLQAGSGYEGFLADKDAYSVFAAVEDGKILSGLEAVLLENYRVLQHGFTDGELERAKKDVLASYEQAYNERDKTSSALYASEYIRNFLESEALPGIEAEFEFVKQILPSITLEETNKLAAEWITSDNQVVWILAPEKEDLKLPTEEEVKSTIEKAKSTEIEAYEDNTVDEPLIVEELVPARVIGQKQLSSIGAVEYTYANGVKAVMMPTDFKNDQVLMAAYSLGGSSLISDEEYIAGSFSPQIISQSGLRVFSASDLQKQLAGKNVRVNTYISELEEGFSGSAVPKDLETMLQLVNLHFTAVREDNDAFLGLRNQIGAILKNYLTDPNAYFQDQLSRLLTQNSIRGRIPTVEEIESVELDEVLKIYKDRFSDPSDFTFFFVGNFDTEELNHYVGKYIGSIPSEFRNESYEDLGIYPPEGKVEKIVKKGSEPQSSVRMYFTGKLIDAKHGYYLRSLSEVLTNKLIESLREEKSGVYGVGANSSTSFYPEPRYTFTVSFPCAPENVDSLTQAVLMEIKKLQESGPLDEDMTKIKETQRRQIEKNIKENSYWLSGLKQVYYRDVSAARLTEEAQMNRIDRLKSKYLQMVANKYLNTEEFIYAVLYPEEGEASANVEETPSLPSDITAESVIDNYLAAIGGKEKLETITGMQMDASMSVMGTSIEVSVAQQMPDKYAMSQNTPMGAMKQVYDGKVLVVDTPEGRQEAPEAIEDVKYQIPVFFELSYQEMEISAKLIGADVVAEKEAYKIEFSYPNGNTTTRWYDAESGLLIKYSEGPQEVVVIEYETIDGIQFPKVSKLSVQGMDLKMNVDKRELNPSFDESTFKTEE